MDPISCPEPCTGRIVSYFWEANWGSVHLFDNASTNADPQPCWFPVYEEIYDGPPPKGVTSWDQLCIDDLVQALEDRKNNGRGTVASSPSSTLENDDNDDVGSSSSGSAAGGNSATVVVALIVPAVLILCVSLAVAIVTHVRARRKRMIKATEEAWGVGKDAAGAPASNETSPDGFMSSPVVAWKGSVAAVGDADCSYPKRVFTDVEVYDMEQRSGTGGEVYP